MSHSCVASENTHVQFQHWRQLEGSEFKFLTFFCLSSKKGKKKNELEQRLPPNRKATSEWKEKNPTNSSSDFCSSQLVKIRKHLLTAEGCLGGKETSPRGRGGLQRWLRLGHLTERGQWLGLLWFVLFQHLPLLLPFLLYHFWAGFVRLGVFSRCDGFALLGAQLCDRLGSGSL